MLQLLYFLVRPFQPQILFNLSIVRFKKHQETNLLLCIQVCCSTFLTVIEIIKLATSCHVFHYVKKPSYCTILDAVCFGDLPTLQEQTRFFSPIRGSGRVSIFRSSKNSELRAKILIS